MQNLLALQEIAQEAWTEGMDYFERNQRVAGLGPAISLLMILERSNMRLASKYLRQQMALLAAASLSRQPEAFEYINSLRAPHNSYALLQIS